MRNALGALKRAGLITVARGTGGAELARTPQGNHSARYLSGSGIHEPR
ncbi:hypothetical protein [Bifidobacterium longum]|nr:hypothetical protein [Bifidobacterium longum]MDL5506920.1 hypothetical protein [Bifidobacterium longum]MDR4042457.1 hypothetical protein [Bifidobacterium sp.]MEC3823519.1 hypothetical protein [Bifidobacterium longum]